MNHIGFIMDGNRRFAEKLSTMITLGHKQWGETLETVIGYCLDAGISYASFWALSRENILERSETELVYIYNLLRTKFPPMIERFQKADIVFEAVGDFWILPPDIRQIILDAIEKTACDTPKMTVIFALGYSGQDEIVRGVKRCIAEWIDPRGLDEKTFLTYLDTGRYPPPDLIVRTGGNIRHSGYFLYQSAYSEYYFTEKLWPEFDKAEFEKALTYYSWVKRNFGK